MKIIINGKAKELPGPMTVAELVEHLGLKPGRVAVELNREIVPRSRHAEVQVTEGAVLEIVQAVGGG
jgi:sulfur carrier protein